MPVIKVSTINFLPVKVYGENNFHYFSICRNPDFGKPPKSGHNIVVSRHSTSFSFNINCSTFSAIVSNNHYLMEKDHNDNKATSHQTPTLGTSEKFFVLNLDFLLKAQNLST